MAVTADDVVQGMVNQASAQAGIGSSVVTEYVIMAATSGFDSQGNPCSQTFLFSPPGPTHRILGLVEAGRLRLRSQMLDADADA